MFEDFTTGMLWQSDPILADSLELATARICNIITQVILAILNFVFYATAIGISLRAKPLVGKPYRWGVYVGMTAGWMALLLFVSAVVAFAAGNLSGGSILFINALFAAVSCLGILRRRKFGAVSLGLAYAMLVLISPYLAPMPNWPLFVISNQPSSMTELARQAITFPWIISSACMAVFLVSTFIYFKNRWSLMKEGQQL
jgi:hypothetical protein